MSRHPHKKNVSRKKKKLHIINTLIADVCFSRYNNGWLGCNADDEPLTTKIRE